MLKFLISLFLDAPSVVIFFFALLAGFDLYSSSNPGLVHYITVLNLIGYTALGAWVLAIADRSNKEIKRQEIELGTFRFTKVFTATSFISGYTLIAVAYTLDEEIISTIENLIPITVENIIAVIMFAFVLSIIFMVITTSKLLVSAESGKEESFEKYVSTILFFFVPWFGIWQIHPRARRL